MGIICVVAIFALPAEFTIGGLLSRVYETLEHVSFIPRHPTWFSFVIAGFLSVLVAHHLCCFPRNSKRSTYNRH